LVLSLPGMIAALVGLELGGGDVTSMMEEVAGAAEAAMADVQDGLTALTQASNILHDLAWISKPTPAHHRAAVKIQRFRQKQSLMRQGQAFRASSKIQAYARGRQVRRAYEDAVSKLPEEHRKLQRAAASKYGDDLSEAVRAASMSWVDREVMRDLMHDRLARARDANRRAKSFSRRTRVSDDTLGVKSQAAVRTRTGDMAAPPGTVVLRDVVVEGVGIVYTRARPAGRQTSEDLKSSALRLKRRAAQKALPAEMPPRPPTIAGAGGDFFDVVRAAQRREETGYFDDGVASVAGAVSGTLSVAVSGAGSIMTSISGGVTGGLSSGMSMARAGLGMGGRTSPRAPPVTVVTQPLTITPMSNSRATSQGGTTTSLANMPASLSSAGARHWVRQQSSKHVSLSPAESTDVRAQVVDNPTANAAAAARPIPRSTPQVAARQTPRAAGGVSTTCAPSTGTGCGASTGASDNMSV